MRVEADIFTDGTDQIACRVLFRHESEAAWREARMTPIGSTRFRAEVVLEEIGVDFYCVEAWIDRFRTWQRDLARRHGAGHELAVELAVGAALLRRVAEAAPAGEAEALERRAAFLASDAELSARFTAGLDDALADLVDRWAPRHALAVYDRGQRVVVDRARARFGAWYELFPRSTAPKPSDHGTFESTIAWLPHIAELGFDVLYLPPFHPIGRTNRKGRNNSSTCEPGDPGSLWAVGSEEGGHKAVHPALGTLADFRRLVDAAQASGIEIALDLALQCSPDHPYVREHPRWFRHLPDGSVRFAENPPKKYEDVYPFDMETEDWHALWQEMESIVRFWVEQGVRIFRADNPHTKPFSFWEWLIGRVKADHPEVLFLSEAFTAPPAKYHLAKLGFSQSYTYFAWRNTKQELTEYLQEIVLSPVKEHFRPNLWPNTPDILSVYLQSGGPGAFAVRLVLAATLSASYGIYGPAYELCLDKPLEPGSEEYLDSEKYEVKHWDLPDESSLRGLIAQMNRVRRENAALQRNDTLRFHEVDNDQLIAYSKASSDGANVLLVVVNLDPCGAQAGRLRLPLRELGLAPEAPFLAHDLLDGSSKALRGERHEVHLDPNLGPALIWRLEASPPV